MAKAEEDGVARLEALIGEAGASWNVPVSTVTRAGLLAYGALLLAWRERINVTGARSMDELARTHFPDAFALASRLGGGDSEPSVVDVGSGGGLPAIPLALLAPGARIVMIEPIAKKAAFLRTAIRELQLGRRVRLEVRRLEGPSATGDFDVAMSRATFPPPEWLALAKQLVHPGGRVFVLGSRGLEVVPPDLELVYAVPYLGGQRWLFELKRST